MNLAKQKGDDLLRQISKAVKLSNIETEATAQRRDQWKMLVIVRTGSYR